MNRIFNNSIFIFFILALSVYVIARTVFVSLTYDEILTLDFAKHYSWKKVGDSANTHLLNTWLTQSSYAIFGESKWTVRLPNVLALFIYLYGVVRIFQLISLKYKWQGLAIVSCMPFMIDFFSLCRGYGLAIGFLMLSVFFITHFVYSHKPASLLFSICSGILGFLSNFTLLHFLLPLIILVFAILFSSRFSVYKKFILGVLLLLPVIFVTVIISPVISELIRKEELYFGGRNNFFDDTVLSLARCYAYHQSYFSLAKVFFMFLFFTSCIFSVLFVFNFLNQKKINFKLIISSLFLLSIASCVFQFLLFKTHLPVERTAIFFYPLMMLNLISGIHYYYGSIRRYVFNFFAFLMLIHFVFSANLEYTYSWKYDSSSENLIQFISENDLKNETIGIDNIVGPSLNFYKIKYGLDSVKFEVIPEVPKFCMGLEELEPSYYDIACKSSDFFRLNFQDLVIKYQNVHYYYLDAILIESIKDSNIQIQVLKYFKGSNTYLIKIQG